VKQLGGMRSVRGIRYSHRMTELREIDVDFNFFDDTPQGKDPDSHSPRLRQYHQMLWSKPLPDGRPFELARGNALSPYLVYDADGLRFRLGSDTIATRHRKKLRSLFEQVPLAVTDGFLRRSYTICGFMIFPVATGSTNQERGKHHLIQDRWDLTLESIRRFYEGGSSPLADAIGRQSAFFKLFGSFGGYVNHFHLNDFLDVDGGVRFLLPFDDFNGPALPPDLSSYERYLGDSLQLFEARRDRLQREISG